MIGILLFLGVGIATAALVGFGDDDDGSADTPGMPDSLTDGRDEVIGADYESGAALYLDDLVTEGEITQGDAETLLAAAIKAGPMSIDMGGGDDSALGSAADDTILAGDGDDYATGGEGDDMVDLGAGDDAYGVDNRAAFLEDDILSFPYDAALYGSEEEYEAGDDTITGGSGADVISDSYGANEINGQQGNDFIISVDADGLTPDTVKGGHGDDILLVDEGDTVATSIGADTVTVDLWAGVTKGYSVVTVEDFDPATDVIELEGSSGLLRTPVPEGPDDVTENPITVADNSDGTGAIVYVSGVPVVLLIGGQGMTTANIAIST